MKNTKTWPCLLKNSKMESPIVFSDTLSPSPGGPRIMSLTGGKSSFTCTREMQSWSILISMPWIWLSADQRTGKLHELLHSSKVKTSLYSKTYPYLACFRWRSQLDKERVKPLMAGNMVPLCSYQYERTFNTTRIPGIDKDKIVKLEDSRHVAVYHKGRWFKVYCYYAGRLLTTSEIEHQLDLILKDDTPPAR